MVHLWYQKSLRNQKDNDYGCLISGRTFCIDSWKPLLLEFEHLWSKISWKQVTSEIFVAQPNQLALGSWLVVHVCFKMFLPLPNLLLLGDWRKRPTTSLDFWVLRKLIPSQISDHWSPARLRTLRHVQWTPAVGTGLATNVSFPENFRLIWLFVL